MGAINVTENPMFDLLVHADWSVSPKKCWAALAEWVDGWTITRVGIVGPTDVFVSTLLNKAVDHRVLAGFDFPIGLPLRYGKKTGASDFSSFLKSIGSGRWTDFADIARNPNEISIERPFYPAGSQGGVTQAALIKGHAEESFDDLRRECERATSSRRAACPIFWTLGGNQVGRGALSGWMEVVKPAQVGGAVLWPFDGDMEQLSAKDGLVIAETYPAEAYGHVGVTFAHGESKTSRVSRLGKGLTISAWAAKNKIKIAPPVRDMIAEGFGDNKAGEDRFDALMGLLGMIEVADRRRYAASPTRAICNWEGWMIGQAA